MATVYRHLFMPASRIIAIHAAPTGRAVKLGKEKAAENHKIRKAKTESEGEDEKLHEPR